MNDIEVTVCCSAYNHEKYIRKCLEGFVMQKDVSFEVIIHDDASTDNTASIIREYEKKYPNIIKPIYQTENQYSKKIAVLKTFVLPKATGKYIAFCEGDDYWSDPYKLSKQVKAMEENPECKACLHLTGNVNESGELLSATSPNANIPSGKYNFSEFSKWIGEFFHLSSFMFEREEYIKLRECPPEFKKVSNSGDKSNLLYFCAKGPVIYINEIMSYYRVGSIESWTQRMLAGGEKSVAKHYDSMISMYKEFDIYTEKKYSGILSDIIKELEYDKSKNEFPYRKVFSKANREFFSKESTKQKAMIILKAFCPHIMPKLLKMYHTRKK